MATPTPPPLPQQPQPAPKKSGCLRVFLIVCAVLFGLFVLLIIISVAVTPRPTPRSSDSATQSPVTSQQSAAPAAAATPQRRTEGKRKIYTTGETLSVGYTAYKVNDSWFTKRLSENQFLNEPPDATYLFVDVTVQNTDKKERTIPPFKLLDENGAEYGTSDKSLMAEGSIGLLHNLNPGVGKRAYVIFDVPTDHTYRLLVSGGYWSREEALVELTPRTKNK
jgi:Domain of unknown function (DUF4352)